jgi:hypothetical protein
MSCFIGCNWGGRRHSDTFIQNAKGVYVHDIAIEGRNVMVKVRFEGQIFSL